MGRTRVWTPEEVEDKIIPKIHAKMSIQRIASHYGLSRQRVYKLLDDAGYNSDGTPKGDPDES